MRKRALLSSLWCCLKVNFCSSMAFLFGYVKPIVTTSATSWKPKIANILIRRLSNNLPSKTGRDPWTILLGLAMSTPCSFLQLQCKYTIGSSSIVLLTKNSYSTIALHEKNGGEEDLIHKTCKKIEKISQEEDTLC